MILTILNKGRCIFMTRKKKKSRAVPVVIVITILLIACCVACFYADYFVAAQREAAQKELESRQAEVIARNQQIEAEYAATLAQLESERSVVASASWPDHKNEGWDLLDLTGYPLENPTAETHTRADVMNNGMLLINEWHSRPEDFDETGLVALGNYFDWKIQVQDGSVSLFPNAANALKSALDAAREEDLTHFLVSEGYRSYDAQNAMFQAKLEQLSSRYEGEALTERAKREVNYPGTSEFNSGLSFTLRLYDKTDPEVGSAKYSSTTQAKWMNENCWKYGLIFRFPQAGWPLDTTQDKSFKTGVSVKLNLYRFVGKGNAAVMHYMDFCLEEYIEYLEEHPHIALFEDGVLKYEIYRQIVGDSDSFDVQLTRNARSWTSSLDNMGAIVTVFEY